MTTPYKASYGQLAKTPKKWLITGVAGYIGSNLLKTLLKLDQEVVGLDNFATGHQRNLNEVQRLVSPAQWARFAFIRGDICNLDDCRLACQGVDYVLHQAALGSVPRSLEDPITTNATNITSFLNILVAARDAGVHSFTLAASIGLRYFNVFGPRQDPNGSYAAVIPKWTAALLKGDAVYINGDGETSRDFCYIANAVQANLLATTMADAAARNQVYKVAVGDCTTLNTLFGLLRDNLAAHGVSPEVQPVHRDFRAGDVSHSQADLGKAQRLLGYAPTHQLAEGMAEAMGWYVRRVS